MRQEQLPLLVEKGTVSCTKPHPFGALERGYCLWQWPPDSSYRASAKPNPIKITQLICSPQKSAPSLRPNSLPLRITGFFACLFLGYSWTSGISLKDCVPIALVLITVNSLGRKGAWENLPSILPKMALSNLTYFTRDLTVSEALTEVPMSGLHEQQFHLKIMISRIFNWKRAHSVHVYNA